MDQANNREKKLSEARAIVLRKLPRFEKLLATLTITIVATDTLFALDMNTMRIECPAPKVDKLNVEQLAFAIAHELLHLYRGDCYYMELFTQHLWHKAADMSINSYLLSIGFSPVDFIYLPEKYGFAPGRTAIEYYQKLCSNE